jgi:hypothetical protein
MGNELACKLRRQGKSYSGKALLETFEIIFRGDTRLKIPFASIINIKALDGELHVQTVDGPAVFELGTQAEKGARRLRIRKQSWKSWE